MPALAARRRGYPAYTEKRDTYVYVMVFLRNYALALACIPFGSVGRTGRKTNMRYVYVASFIYHLRYRYTIDRSC